nr:sugar-binding domain-containing protein [Streptomyces sp. 846.5]
MGLSSWSASLLATVEAMEPVPGLRDVRIVQAVGGVGDPAAAAHATRLTGRLAQLAAAEASYLPAPGLAGSAESAQVLRQDPFVAASLGQLDDLSVALVGVGEVRPSSTLARSGNAFAPEELGALERMGAVGDICLHFFDADGKPVSSALDERVIGISREQLLAVERRVGVAGGERKHEAIRGALRGGLLHVLVTDRATAQALLA